MNNFDVFTDSPPVPPTERCQARVSYEQYGFAVFCLKKINKQAVPEIHEEGDEFRFRSFNR